MPRTNTIQYQNSVLQKSLRIIRDGYDLNLLNSYESFSYTLFTWCMLWLVS